MNHWQRQSLNEGKKKKTSIGSNWTKIESQNILNEQDFEIGDCNIRIADVDREIWKGITKADLITYYHQVSRYLLPHIKDRPLSLHVKPVNAGAPGFYIKDMENRQPDCATIFTDERRQTVKGKRPIIDYLVCNNEATLLWMINLGCIDVNPWNSCIQTPGFPDFIAIDLDPSDDDLIISRPKLTEAAMAVKDFCDQRKLKAFVKTSGKTGIHFFLPCSGFTNERCRIIAEKICAEIRALVPEISTTENSISSRGGKVYLDPSQNDYADTLASVYSVRPGHHPNVSTPLEWKEVNKNLDVSVFTMKNTLSRVEKKGDLFSGLLDRKQAIKNNRILSEM